MVWPLHHTYIFESDNGAQIAVNIHKDEVIVVARPAASAVWGLPLKQVSESGDPVQFAFEEETDGEVS